MRFSPIVFILFALGSNARAGATDSLQLTGQLADLAAMRTGYVQRSPAFTPENRQRALDYIADLENSQRLLTPEQFLLACLTVSAFAQNGHDGVDTLPGSWFPGQRLPMRLLWLDDGIVVARVAATHADLAGAVVERIEGVTPTDLMHSLRAIGGGVDNFNVWNLNWVIESAGMLHAMGLAAAPDKLKLALKRADGTRVEREIAYVPSDRVPSGVLPGRLWSQAPLPVEVAQNWSVPVHPEPLALQDPENMYRSIELRDIDSLYVQIRINIDFAGQEIGPFSQQLEQQLRQAAPRNLILDLRQNTGGDNEKTRELMRTIARSIKGHIYMLVGGQTFSAGIANAAALKHDAGARVVIVGTPVGDRLQWWSEGHQRIEMPHSRYAFRLNGGYWDLVQGCADKPLCYGDKYDVQVTSLSPQIAAPIRVADWLAGRDSGFEAVLSDLQVRGRKDR
ncbi:S41 family peptidase [Paucibacter sp. B2R-40]|uniref:S41 family peptidase n=1 Tax=Paucibacter sp. B2R-40 TaxID=2893554 RepID=UPI0021E4A0CF|nr:S41 family peptidase [Paucibacter sp. B2R-40]MCV2354750.1 S41 family peptidase [Paucibacter sp. B2R-40]